MQVHQLDITPSQLCLRLPMVVRHCITQDSPLATWRSGPSGVGGDASSEIVVVVSPSEVSHVLGSYSIASTFKHSCAVHYPCARTNRKIMIG